MLQHCIGIMLTLYTASLGALEEESAEEAQDEREQSAVWQSGLEVGRRRGQFPEP